MSLQVAHIGISAPIEDPVALQGVSPQAGLGSGRYHSIVRAVS